MKAREPVNRYMTEAVQSIEVGAPAAQLLHLFDAAPFHHLPVVEDGRLVGILGTAGMNKLRTFLPRNLPDPDAWLNEHVRIDRLMRWPPITVGGTQSLEHAVDLMVEHGVHALPVTDAGGRLTGILTTSDLLRAALHPERRGGDEPEGDAGDLRRELQQLRARLKDHEHAVNCAERYMRAGQDERLHAALLKALAKVRGEGSPQSRPVML